MTGETNTQIPRPFDPARVRALCFDVDGTLRDTDDRYTLNFAKVFRWFRFLLPGQDEIAFARRFVMRIETPANLVYSLPDRLGIDDELAKISDYIHARRPKRPHPPFLIIPGIKAMLEQLAEVYPMAVISARGKRGTMAFLNQHELTSYFQCIATAQTAPYTKPYPDPVLWAARQMNVAPGECAMIGDTTLDIRAGAAAGAQTVGVLCGFGERSELQKAGANLILGTTADLLNILPEKQIRLDS